MKKKINLVFLFSICLFATTTVLAYKCPNNLDYVGCGSGVNGVTGIPAIVPRLVSFAINLMKVIIPVSLIITGTIEMFKSIIAGNPDNIPKGKKKIINKFVAALLAFFIISFTTNIVKLIAKKNERSTLAACLSCYLNNNCNDDISACTDVNDQEIGGESNDSKVITQKDDEIHIKNDNNGSNLTGFNPSTTGTTTTTTTGNGGSSVAPNNDSNPNEQTTPSSDVNQLKYKTGDQLRKAVENAKKAAEYAKHYSAPAQPIRQIVKKQIAEFKPYDSETQKKYNERILKQS